jgi:hypothetical protein
MQDRWISPAIDDECFFFAHEYHQQMMIDGNLLKNVVVKMEIVKRQLMFCLFNGDTFTF